jgi:hypothetical protein
VIYADSTLRPLARRRLITSRPFLVAIRARNPWVRLRLITLGWNVRFMVYLPVFDGAKKSGDSNEEVKHSQFETQISSVLEKQNGGNQWFALDNI